MTDGSYTKRSLPTTIGFVVWRIGAYFCAGYLAYRGVLRTLRILLEIDLPTQLLVGISMVITGVLFIFVSLIVERIDDARNETGLRD